MDPKKDDQSSGTKPWDQSFADDRDDQGNLSRTKRHRQSHNNRLITIILVAIIIIIAVGSLIYGLARQSAMNKPDNSMSVSSEQTSSASATSHKKAAKSASEKADSSSRASASSSSEEKAAKISSEQAIKTSEKKAAREQRATRASSSAKSTGSNTSKHSSSSTSGAKYATVGAGQGMYRVAVNNGISVERLKALNGLSDNANLTPGQKLRVK